MPPTRTISEKAFTREKKTLEKKIKREKEQVEKRKRKEDRIVSMVMVMGLALMVYSLAEHKLREAQEKENEVIPDQRNKPTKKPTMRRVFQAKSRENEE